MVFGLREELLHFLQAGLHNIKHVWLMVPYAYFNAPQSKHLFLQSPHCPQLCTSVHHCMLTVCSKHALIGMVVHTVAGMVTGPCSDQHLLHHHATVDLLMTHDGHISS